MDAERWKQIDNLLDAIFALEPEKRPAFLKEVCGEDEELKNQIESLVAADQRSRNFIDGGAVQEIQQLIKPAAIGLKSGQSIGPYTILSRVGAGGMGEVYIANDSRLKRKVAIKTLQSHLSSDPQMRQRFEREARAVSALSHPNICAIYDVGNFNNVEYIVMEYIEGKTLSTIMQGEPLGTKLLLTLAVGISDGLAAAHRAGIIHRDLKPGNVMVTPDGRVKILDFGLAKQTTTFDQETETASGPITQTGMIHGTVPYMSPEQASGKVVDFHSDQFSFGIMLYEMATGKNPFSRNTAAQTLAAIIQDEPEPISNLNPKIPAPLRWLVDRCLAKEPHQRYDSTLDLSRHLRDLHDRLSEASSAIGVKPVPQKNKLIRGVMLAGLMVLATLIVALWLSQTIVTSRSFSSYRFVPFVSDSLNVRDPAWSPDNKTIAYLAEVDGDMQVFARSIDSPVSTQVTNLPTGCFRFFWSPDGTRIFAITNMPSDLWSISPAGGAPQSLISNVLSATISPDGKTLALFRSDHTDGPPFQSFWISSPPGAEPKLQSRFAPGNYWYSVPHFSPDGSKIGVWLSGGNTKVTFSEFWIIPYPEGKPKKILPKLSTLPWGNRNFSWMPDSTHIVFQAEFSGTTRNHLWLADTKKEIIQQITTTTTAEMDPSVSSDGQKIAFTSDNKQYDLVEVPLDGSEIKNLLSTSRDELDPTWSPSGQQYAYVTNRIGNKEIWIKNVQDGWERPLVTSKDFPKTLTFDFFAPSFSADGQYISYSRHGDDGMAIWISPVTGGPPVRLQSGGQNSTWSPYGNYIAYIQGKEGDFSLQKALVGSNDKPILIRDHVYLDPPAWSPQGNWISCMAPGGWMLISSDGKTEKRVTPEVVSPLVHGWSKDGKKLYRLFMRNHNFFLDSVDVESGQIKTINLSPTTNFNYMSGFSISPSGTSFVTSVERGKSEIWLLERTDSQPANLLERIFRIFGTRS